MSQEPIDRYLFNASTNIGIEVKPIDFLWKRTTAAQITHRIDFYHFIWVEEGECSFTIDFEKLCLRSGDAFLIMPGQVCSFDSGVQSRGYSVLFVPEFLGEDHADSKLLHSVSGMTPLVHKVVSLTGLPIGDLLQQLIHELNRPVDEYQSVVARSCLRILLAEVARRLPFQATELSKPSERFFEAVEKHFDRLYNVSDYLSLLNMSEKVLTQVVRQAVGLTPKVYLDKRRTLEAKRLLAYTKLSVKEISFALGFDEPTNFNKFFRKHVGVSANDFRLQSLQL